MMNGEKKDIFNEFNYLYSCYNQIQAIDYINFPHISDSIGLEPIRVDELESYIEAYYNALNSNKFSIKMFDESLLFMNYRFSNDDLIYHKLAFFPSPHSNAIYKNSLNTEYINTELLENLDKHFPELLRFDETISYDQIDISKKLNLLSLYIRIDFDMEGNKKYIHTPVHLHSNFCRDGLRWPIRNALSPCEFVYLILRYVYDIECDFLKEKVLEKTSRKDYLDKDEVKLLKFCIG